MRPLKVRQVLHKHGDPVSEIYFPGRCVCAITNVMEDGGVVGVATVGREGLVGIAAVFGSSVAVGEAFVQIAAEPAAVMTIDAFRCEMARRGAFHDRVTKYSQAFVSMLMQSVACDGLHSAEERCCRWLLMTHDRIAQNEIPLTHELLAIMLGVRRPTVSLVMAELTGAGISRQKSGLRLAAYGKGDAMPSQMTSRAYALFERTRQCRLKIFTNCLSTSSRIFTMPRNN